LKNSETVVGQHGNMLMDTLGDVPGCLSLRSGEQRDMDAWRSAARKRVWELMAPTDVGPIPEKT